MNTIQQSHAASYHIVQKPATTPGTDDRVARLALHLGLTSAVLTTWLHVKPRTRGLASNLLGYALKVISAATAPILVATGFTSALLTGRRRFLHSLPGWIGALLGLRFIWQVFSHADLIARPNPSRSPNSGKCTEALRSARLSPSVHRGARMTRNLTFATVAGSEHRSSRPLLCDLWEPAPGVTRSSLGIIYLHGGAWQSFDKDVMTRRFFRHLAAQGHVVMDVAYRMVRETDMHGMLGDVKRAVAWLKRHSATLGVDPTLGVLAGGSAGGHLALLAGYTPNSPEFDPADVHGTDTSVCAVIAFYPVADLRTLSDHWSEQAMHPLATALGRVLGFFPPEGYLPWTRLAEGLFGSPLDRVSDALLTYSPVAHVGPHCPPTLILQGLHDHVIPVEDVFALHNALVSAGNAATLVSLPMVEHAFDMLPLRISPPARVAYRAIDRFLTRLP